MAILSFMFLQKVSFRGSRGGARCGKMNLFEEFVYIWFWTIYNVHFENRGEIPVQERSHYRKVRGKLNLKMLTAAPRYMKWSK